MPRNLVICCDGTNNQFGPENTNVVRLIQVLDRDPQKQRLYYDPGVGTLPEPNIATRIGKKLNDLFGLAFGAGLTWKVQEAYSNLMEIWEPGDQVFVFGFSRGAYSARVLAGLLHSLGLLPRGAQNLVPYVMRLYESVRKTPSHSGADGYWKLCNQFRWTFAREVGADDNRRFKVHFLGLWDTVSSVGWVWDPSRFPYTAHNPSVGTIRHAVSIDERRWFFRQNLMQQSGLQDWQERWFAGVHCDVGGGYPEAESGLWECAFEWVLREAVAAGLLLDPGRLDKVLHRAKGSDHPWIEPQHESLRGLWWLAEFFPKWQKRPDQLWARPRVGLGRHRYVQEGAMIHQSVLRRIRETGYAPPNLSDAFFAQVRALAEVPESLPFTRPPS